MTSLQFQLVLVSLVVAAAAAADSATTPFLAKQDQTQEAKHPNSVVSVRVKNDASVKVHLLSCKEKSSAVTVDPGSTKTIELQKLPNEAFGESTWVVPDGATLHCDKGPFEFFYIATDVNSATKALGAFVGFGVEMREQDDRNSTTFGESVDYTALLEAEEKTPLDLHGVTGLQLTAGEDAISCMQNFCEENFPVTAPSAGMELTIKGSSEPETPVYLNLWGWRRRGWGYRRWGWGYRGGWGYRRWGWGGYRRWRWWR
eukprot:TRINITY_DN1366_c0_g1_i1.p1 TRINITY_DN1366_c0_g1~~TRINITY_DN1366_c0_g1_i1.p1  ORF type:complete len:258 (-),score=62.68 TRINITY_DN1366_c0_g1_i1:347-1120(-)